MPNLQNGDTGKKLIEEVNSALDRRGNVVGYDENGPIINDNPQEIKGSILVEKDVQAERILGSGGYPLGSVRQFTITEASHSFMYGDEYKNRLVFIITRDVSSPKVTIGFLSKDMTLQLGVREGSSISCSFSVLDTSGSYDHTFKCPLVYNIVTKKFYWTSDGQPIENNLNNHGATIKQEDNEAKVFENGYAPTYDAENKILSFDTSKNIYFKTYFRSSSRLSIIDNFYTYGSTTKNYPRTKITAEGLDIIMQNSPDSSFKYLASEEFSPDLVTIKSGIITIDLSKIEEALNRVIGYVYIV